MQTLKVTRDEPWLQGLRFGFYGLLFIMFLTYYYLPKMVLSLSQYSDRCRSPYPYIDYTQNLWHLQLILASFLLCVVLESLLILQLARPESKASYLLVPLRAIFKSFPFVLLYCSYLALPYARGYYLIAGLFGIALSFAITQVPGFKIEFEQIDNYETRIWLRYVGIAIAIFLLIYYVFFNPAYACKITTVQANMHSFQTMVETYAVDHKGLYPENVLILQKEAQQTDMSYWKDFTAPIIDGEMGFKKSFDDYSFAHFSKYKDYLGIRIIISFSSTRGQVLYQRLSPTQYKIYGSDRGGFPVMKKGKIFYLSNF